MAEVESKGDVTSAGRLFYLQGNSVGEQQKTEEKKEDGINVVTEDNSSVHQSEQEQAGAKKDEKQTASESDVKEPTDKSCKSADVDGSTVVKDNAGSQVAPDGSVTATGSTDASKEIEGSSEKTVENNVNGEETTNLDHSKVETVTEHSESEAVTQSEKTGNAEAKEEVVVKDGGKQGDVEGSSKGSVSDGKQEADNEKTQNLPEKDQDSEEVFHEAPEASEEVEVEKTVVREDGVGAAAAELTVVSNKEENGGEEGLVVDSEGDHQNDEGSVNDGDTAEHWVDADEESDQNDVEVSDEKREGDEEAAENQEDGENEDVVNGDNGDDTVDDDEIAGNPAYIPKSPRYYMHDSRVVDEDETAVRSTTRVSRADGKWKHDKFDERSQAPKSKRELVVRYGFDIRNQEKANDGEGNRSAKGKHDNRAKDEPIMKNDNARNLNRGGVGGRGGRGGNAGRSGQMYNDRQNRDNHMVRNNIPHQQQPQGRAGNYGPSRGRGASNRGMITNRGGGGRQMHPQHDHGRSGDGRFRGSQQRDHVMQSKRPIEHATSRRGRNTNFSNNGDGNSVSNNSRNNATAAGGGGKRYSKQRTTVPYSEQQRTLKMPPTAAAATAVPDVVTQIAVPSLPSAAAVAAAAAAAAAQQPQPPPPSRNPVDWQRGPPPPPPPAAFQAPPPIRPPLQALGPPIQAQLSTIAAAAVAPVTPTAYRAPNDTVYFDPNEQIIRSTAPPQPRAKKRLEIVSPAD